MPDKADLILYDQLGRLSAVVEVKNKRGTTLQWASVFRRNLAAHDFLTAPGFFLIVTPDRIYVWKESGTSPEATPPDFMVDAEPVLRPYLERAGLDPEKISGQAFEMVVATWLSDLLRQNASASHHDWTEASGFFEAIKDGRIDYPAAA